MLMLIGIATNIQAQEYITDVITLGAESGKQNSLKKEYADKGWTVLGNDLNRGAEGWFIYVAWKTSSKANPETGYITDLCVSDKNVSYFTFEGRTYYRASANNGFNGNLNRGTGKKTADIWLYYTRDRINLGTYGSGKRVMTALSVTGNTEDGDANTAAISWRNAKYSGIADMNKGAGGDYIYIQQHFTTQTLKWTEEPAFAADLTYNGYTHSLIAKNPWNNNYGKLQYRVDGGDWNAAEPSCLAVGTYKVEARLEGVSAHDIAFADNSSVISKTVTITPPILKASNLKGVFNQGDKRVNLSWDFSTIGGYSDLKWVVYRDGTKIAELPSEARAYTDRGFTNEAEPVYDVYYVSNFWDVTTRHDDTKATVTVNTTRSVPVNNLQVEQQDDRIIFTWTSDAYPKDFGNKFRIYVDDEDAPICTITPADMQDSLRWEHRTTDQHTNRQNKIDAETGVPYTEEPLNACDPHTYRIAGVIGDAVLNTNTADLKAVGEATKFYSLEASKGVYEGSVKLSWHVNLQGSAIAKTYIVERRRAEQENEAWEALTRMSSNEDYLFYTDETALPGVFYDYRITVEDKCADGAIIHSDKTDIGFAKSSGTVTGRIAYGSTGTAVQDVEVVMTMTGSGGDQPEQFHSIYFSDVNGGVTWEYPSEDYASDLFAAKDFSLQMWLYPEAFSKSLIADLGGGIGLGMTADGKLTFSDGTATQTFDSIALKKNAYNHVVLTRSGKTLIGYVLTTRSNSSEPIVQTDTLQATGSKWALASATRFTLGHFNGAADDFRLWTKCLSEADIRDNYDHLLVGDEKQLETYWTFDEGLRTQFFDYSRDGSNYRKHHGQIGSNAQTSTLTPGALRLKAKTDADGNYVIQGIPFTGEGTTYSVIPLYGIHEFNPNKKVLFVGNNALVHTAEFEDVSSFPMEGYIYYAGTNVPVEGIPLYVDGLPVSKNGEMVKTASNGFYSISVPIGQHYVEAKLDSHDMVGGGRFPTKGTFYFDRAMTYDFTDSTLVNFVGRVGGGERNDTLAVGFAESKNNIGIATIRLGLLNESFSLNCLDDHITSAAARRTWQSDTTSIQSTAWTGTDYDAKYIYIRTDSLSGEFSALLPPLKYVVKSLGVDNNRDIDFGALPEIDLTSPQKEYTDSLSRWDDAAGDSVTVSYKYNTKKVFTHYAQPEISITESGHDAGVYGLQEIVYTDEQGEEYTIGDLYTQNGDGSANYLLGYPIYQMGRKVQYDIFGFERYVNHDGTEDVTDIVPLPGQEITLTNEMSSEQAVVYRVDDPTSPYKAGEIYELQSNDTQLGNDAHLIYSWMVGLPNIVQPHTRNFSITMTRNGRTYVPTNQDAVVLGQLSYGSNFVTKGPDHVDFVLRDPQGAKSTTKLKTGKITTKTTYDTRRAYGNYGWLNNVLFGFGATVGAGAVGFITISGYQMQNQTDIGVTTSWEKVWNYDEVDVETTTENVSTSAAVPYVGASGDVYVGTSTNFLVGGCRHLFIDKNVQTGQYELKLEDALAIGDSIETAFKYSQYELQNVMIPKWKDMRRKFLTETTSEATAKAYVNNGDVPVYLTWKGLDLDDYTEGTDYRWVTPESWKKTPPDDGAIDSVAWCNNQIVAWQQAIAENEQDKLALMSTTTPENLSIDGGSSYTYTRKTSHSKNHQVTHTWKMGFVLNTKFGYRKNDFTSVANIFNFTTEDGGGFIKGDGTKTENYTEWEYTINDGNRDTDISINVYKSSNPKYSDFFSVFGGQTYNPYQPQEVTQYYLPGTPLGNSTQQMEQPELRISVGDGNPAESVTVTDIPAGQEANVTLHCTNMANANQGVNFSYNLIVIEQSNDQGLEILMDGVPINGRSVLLNQKETTKKVLTIRQTDQSVLDYEGIRIRFCSQYQPLIIYDEVTLNAHFVPSSSPVDLVISEPVLNIETLKRNEGDLELKVTNFNRQFRGMTAVGVEYRYEGSATWTRPDTLTFLVNRKDSTDLHDQVLPATGDLYLRFNMSDDNFYPQGTYTFRAYTTTMYDTEAVTVYSDIVAVTKDNVRPRNLTTPLPANGILSYGDDLVVEFNEDIVPGYVSDKNIIVTAKLNQRPIDHEVSMQFTQRGADAYTESPLFLNGDFSIDLWLNWTANGIFLRQGNTSTAFQMALIDGGHIAVTIGGSEYVSTQTIPQDTWTYLVMSYKSSDMTFSMLAQYGNNNTVSLFSGQKVKEYANYLSDNRLFLGGFAGRIHGLSVFNIYRDVYEAAATKYQSKDNYFYGLAHYWPMDEGHGSVAADSRHTNSIVSEVLLWNIDNDNYSVRLDSREGMSARIADINTTQGESYAIECWAWPGSDTSEPSVVFETGSTPDKKLRLYFDQQRSLMLDYGTRTQTLATADDFPRLTNYSHMALNVVRGQAASFYLNGQRVAVIAETDVPSIDGADIKLAQGLSFFDELRIWHAAITEDRLMAGIYNCIDTAEVYARGLVAYYPFEKTAEVNGVKTKVFTLENMAPRSQRTMHDAPMTILAQYDENGFAPPLKSAPEEERLVASPVASERKVIVNLTGAGISPRDIEGTTLNITVDQIHDMHGNESLPIRWTSYVQLNTLKWTKDSVNIIKKYGDDYTFDVNIENLSGNTEYYTIYNTPQWLTVVGGSPTDNIEPLKTKTLRFKIDPLIAVGNYDVTIGLQGNNEIPEPLRIVMKVSGEKPQWTVDPTKYDHNMTIIGQVYINGILMENEESMVAAFIGGECRGIASPQKVRGAAYVTMTVYGDDYRTKDHQKAVTFRIWDASRGVAYTDAQLTLPISSVAGDSQSPTTAATVIFSQDQMIGNFDTPAIWTKTDKVEQLIPIHQNWNWIAFGVEPESQYLDHIFDSYADWMLLIKSRDTFSDYNGAEWNGTLVPTVNAMYKLKVSRLPSTQSETPNSQLSVSGRQPAADGMPVTLKKGWNWIAYTPLTTMTVDEALAGANPQKGDIVKSQTSVAIYGDYGWEGSLQSLESGHGYLYFSNAGNEKSFIYPAETATHARHLSSIALATSQEAPLRIFKPAALGLYPSNMTMAIRLTADDGLPVDTAEVAAFIDDECRGATHASDNGLYYLVISGDGAGQPMTLRTCIDGDIITIDNTLMYVSDANIGTSWEPYVIDLQNLSSGIRMLDGSTVEDATDWYTLQGFKIGHRPTQPGIYIHHGEKVFIKQKK